MTPSPLPPLRRAAPRADRGASPRRQELGRERGPCCDARGQAHRSLESPFCNRVERFARTWLCGGVERGSEQLTGAPQAGAHGADRDAKGRGSLLVARSAAATRKRTSRSSGPMHSSASSRRVASSIRSTRRSNGRFWLRESSDPRLGGEAAGLASTVVKEEVRRDAEEPRPHRGLLRVVASAGAEGNSEGLAGEVIRVGGTDTSARDSGGHRRRVARTPSRIVPGPQPRPGRLPGRHHPRIPDLRPSPSTFPRRSG